MDRIFLITTIRIKSPWIIMPRNLFQMSRFMTKPTKWMCAQQRLRSAWASAQSDQSLRCALSGWLRTQAFFMRTAKTLIRLGECPGWSESSLGAHPHCWFCHVAAQILYASLRVFWQVTAIGGHIMLFSIVILWFLDMFMIILGVEILYNNRDCQTWQTTRNNVGQKHKNAKSKSMLYYCVWFSQGLWTSSLSFRLFGLKGLSRLFYFYWAHFFFTHF